MSYLRRKVACAICGWYPVVDLEKRTIHCVCCKKGADIPQWVIVSPYNYKQFLKDFTYITKNVFEETLKLIEEATL